MNWQKFPATRDEYYSMLDFVMTAAEEVEVPAKQQVYLELGFEEAVVNVISYAYPATGGEIFISAYREGDYFFVEIKDSGVEFNPLMYEGNANKATDVESAQVGGNGIAFMRRIFHQMTYSYESEGEFYYNRLKLGLKLSDNGEVSL